MHRVVPLLRRGDETALPRERLGDETVVQLDEGCPQQRPRFHVTWADLHERVRLLLARGIDTARPVAIDRAEAAKHAVPHERRRERLAVAALVLSPGEPKSHS